MRARWRSAPGFTIIELLIVVIVIGILAAAGLAKYQSFAEVSRRKTCLGQLQSLENGLAVWETTNQAFAENSKCAFGFTPRTGKLTDTAPAPALFTGNTAGTVPAIADAAAQPTVGSPAGFYGNGTTGPLGSVIRDDSIWVCPSALSRYYGGEIQNVSDDYMDTTGGGNGGVSHGGAPIGLGGRYLCAVASQGNRNSGSSSITNGGFPPGWITQGSITGASTNTGSPCPQVPFRIMLCGSYGTFGTSAGGTVNVPGSSSTNQGGPVGPDGSALNRHSSRW